MSRLPDPVSTLNRKGLEVSEHLKESRGYIDDMYRTLLYHPALTEHVSRLGEYLRFEGTLPGDVREVAILTTARHLKASYEWVKHIEPAKTAGVNEAVIELIRKGENLNSISPVYAGVQKVVISALNRKEISLDLQEYMQKEFGIKGVIELVVLCGFYGMVASVVSAFDVPVPAYESEIAF